MTGPPMPPPARVPFLLFGVTVPIDVPVGALVVVDRLRDTDVFGVTTEVGRANEPGRFQLFEIEGVPGLFVPPATPGTLEGPAVEEVLFVRDELANLVWDVEETVSARGSGSSRRSEQ